jgi:hypothetical protein
MMVVIVEVVVQVVKMIWGMEEEKRVEPSGDK